MGKTAQLQSEVTWTTSEEIVNPYNYRVCGKFYPHWLKQTNAQQCKIGMQLEKLLSVFKWVKVNRRTIGVNGRANLRNHFWIFQIISDTMLRLELLEFFGYSSLIFFFFFTWWTSWERYFIWELYCLSSRLTAALTDWGIKCLAMEFWICTIFSWTLDKTEHTQFAFLNTEDKAEGCLCTSVWQTNGLGAHQNGRW